MGWLCICAHSQSCAHHTAIWSWFSGFEGRTHVTKIVKYGWSKNFNTRECACTKFLNLFMNHIRESLAKFNKRCWIFDHIHLHIQGDLDHIYMGVLCWQFPMHSKLKVKQLVLHRMCILNLDRELLPYSLSKRKHIQGSYLSIHSPQIKRTCFFHKM